MRSFDVAIIGAGLAGMTAGLHLARAGRPVVLLERRDRPGGLCGTHRLDGRDYVIACNDFGEGLPKELRGLGVPIEFRPSRARFALPSGTMELPPDARAGLRLLRAAADYARTALAAWREPELDLATCVASRVRSPLAAELLGSLAYPMGRPAASVPLAALRDAFSREYGYGYANPVVPCGGPQALADAMLRRFRALGGEAELSTDVRDVLDVSDSSFRILKTDEGELRARHVVSSEGRWDEYPPEQRPGLEVSTLHLAVRKDLALPPGIHTFAHVPEGTQAALQQLDEGRAPPRFPFHLFPSELPDPPDHRTMNLYFYLPRGVDDPAPQETERVLAYVREHAERLVPGLAAATIAEHFVSPWRFRQLHGLSPRVAERIPEPGFRRPANYDPERRLFFVGNSVSPPGDHAGAAVLSGRRVAQRILAAARAG